MKVLIAAFRQESNSFSVHYSGKERYNIIRGNDLLDPQKMAGHPTFGLVQVAQENGLEICPSVSYNAGSGGPVEPYVIEEFLEEVCKDIDRYSPLDAVFLGLHGGTDLREHTDLCGYILEKIRAKVGPDVVIVHANDMHANITDKMMENSDACTGFQTYPHADIVETGRRAAMLGVRLLNKQPMYEARVRVPMIVQAEAYNTFEGPFADLVNECLKLIEDKKILDFTIFQMQPWLDVPDAGSTVLVAAEDKETAEKYAKEIADKLFALRKVMALELHDVDKVIDIARNNTSGKPIILVDSADSPNAGSSGDSTFVLEHLLQQKVDFPCCLCIVDVAALEKAMEVGVGNEADFTLGGTLEPDFQKPITIHATVRSLHTDVYASIKNPKDFNPDRRSAVLQIGRIYIVVFNKIGNSSYPNMYVGSGLSLSEFKLIAVKSATQFKLYYKKWTEESYPTDTPGSSSANLAKMPFKYIPRPFWPLDPIETFENKVTFF